MNLTLVSPHPYGIAPCIDRKGNAGCAYSFRSLSYKGNGIYMQAKNTAVLNKLDEMSVSFWYYFTDSAYAPGRKQGLISRDSGNFCPDKYGEWSVGVYDCSRLVFGVERSVWEKSNDSNCGGPDVWENKELAARYSKWRHVVATYNRVDKEMKLYIDGVLQDTDKGDGDCGDAGKLMKDMGDLYIGMDLHGAMDDIIIYKKILNQQEIEQLYQLVPCCGALPQ